MSEQKKVSGFLCQECPTKNICKDLCADAEAYVSQDCISKSSYQWRDLYYLRDNDQCKDLDDGILLGYLEKSVLVSLGLTDKENAIIYYRYFKHKPHKEIATILGIEYSGYYKRLHNKALDKVKAMLKFRI